MPVPSLLQLAKKACIANIRSIDDVGDIPYSILRPVLLKIESPQQLRKIEQNSPQICELDAEIWQHFIKRDIPNWENKRREPKNPKNWWKTYRKLRREAEEEVRAQEDALKAALNERKSEKESHRVTMVNKVLEDPEQKKRRPAKYPPSRGTASPAASRSDARTKSTTGNGLFNKFRREIRDASFMTTGKGALATPTHLLAQKTFPSSNLQVTSSGARLVHRSGTSSSTVPSVVARPVASIPPKDAPGARQRIAGTKRLPPSVFLPPNKKTKY